MAQGAVGSAEVFIRSQSHSWDLHRHGVNSPKAPPANPSHWGQEFNVCVAEAHTQWVHHVLLPGLLIHILVVDCCHSFLRVLKALTHLPKIRISSDVSEPQGKIYTEANLSSALSLRKLLTLKCSGGVGLGWCICLQKDKTRKEKQQQYNVWLKKKKPKPNKCNDTLDSCDSL